MPPDAQRAPAPPPYLEAVALIERAHRRLHDVIKDELARRGRGEVNTTQAMILYGIGDRELSHAQLRAFGRAVSTNPSHNKNKLVALGMLEQRDAPDDGRAIRLRLTDKGREIAAIVAALYERQGRTVAQLGQIDAPAMDGLCKALARLERFWGDAVAYRL